MFYIYKKTHNVTGLQYLGYTKKDPNVYKGSGVRWLRHLAKHGDNVSTEILCACESKEEVRETGRYYSNLWNIVESAEWANMKSEEADGGDMRGSEKWVNTRKSEAYRQKQADGARGNTNVRGLTWWYNLSTGERVRRLHSPGTEWVNKFQDTSEEVKAKISLALKHKPKSKEHKDKLSKAAKGRVSNNKGTKWWTNGIINKRSNQCPGESFYLGTTKGN